jgi:hypothetical protein
MPNKKLKTKFVKYKSKKHKIVSTRKGLKTKIIKVKSQNKKVYT